MIVALAALATLISAGSWFGAVRWTPDGLAYQAKTLEIRGEAPATAEKDAVAATGVMRLDYGRGPRVTARSLGTAMPYYRRRLLVPAVAALIYPLTGTRSLLAVSIAAYVLLIPALYGLLRLRFSRRAAAISAGCMALFPPLIDFSMRPLTDAPGLLMLVVAGIAAMLVVRHGMRWLPLWIAAVAVGSVTREGIAVVIIACGLLALEREARMRAAALFVSGVAAAAPATLLLGFPYRRELAVVTAQDLRVHVDQTWLGILHHWIDAVVRIPVWDFRDVPLATVILAAGLALFLLGRDRSVDGRMMRALLVGGFVFLAALPNPTQLRLEFVLLPVVAYGFALVVEDADRLRTPARVTAKANDHLTAS